LIEETENGLFIGRTYFQAPEVDGITYVEGMDLEIGDMVNVKITDALPEKIKLFNLFLHFFCKKQSIAEIIPISFLFWL
jgi:hypothetical protein